MPLFAALIWCVSAVSAVAIDVKAAVLRIDYPTLLPISRYDLKPDDLGFAGAVLGDEDNGTTGSFLGHTYETAHLAVPPEQADDAMDQLLAEGVRLFVVLADAPDVLRLTDKAAEAGALVFNASAPDVDLRDANCRRNLLHIAPSRAMNTDAVAQFAVWKKWGDWFLLAGSNPDDVKLADAYRRSATKFGANIAEDRTFEDTGGSRRTDSGHVLVQRQLPIDTQGARDHDVVIAADESDYFGRYLSYHLWTPRPVMGSGGLRPVTFHGAHEAWGATQYQTRFEELTGRYVRPEDYNVWLALRVIGEAVTRANTSDPDGVRDYAVSDEFELAAFKGQKVTFREWNGQLRQPILLYDGSITVSVSPQDGFLHQSSTLDTMGLDRAESKCTAFD
ncbi:ABC transporter substrate-binding protein [uncultured Ruegeria sp.]|uniref:ABC transporter substrate-binding protein n=1 Tax=uncultured Ruegeria sp. TaxID=259304 RepID=UPI002633EF25|nr:ABC transporter substrate-binding protein [uncultured Ruegeria sp.]